MPTTEERIQLAQWHLAVRQGLARYSRSDTQATSVGRRESSRLDPPDAKERVRIAAARYELYGPRFLPLMRYGGHDVSNQPRDEDGRWTRVGGTIREKQVRPLAVARPRPAVVAAPSPVAVADQDQAGHRRFQELNELWKQFPVRGPRGLVQLPRSLTAQDKRDFLSESIQRQQAIIDRLKSIIEATRKEAAERERERSLPAIGPQKPGTIDLPIEPTANAPFADRLKYYEEMRRLAFLTRNPELLVDPPADASPNLHYLHARDIGELTGDWSHWALSRMDKVNELAGALAGVAAARGAGTQSAGTQREMAHGAPLKPLPGPHVLSLSPPGPRVATGQVRPTLVGLPNGADVGISPRDSGRAHSPPLLNKESPKPPATQSPPSQPLLPRDQPTMQLPPRRGGLSSAIDIARQHAALPPATDARRSIKLLDPRSGRVIGEQSIDGLRGWKVEADRIHWWNFTPHENQELVGGRRPTVAMAGSVPIPGDDDLSKPPEVHRVEIPQSSGGSTGRSNSGASLTRPSLSAGATASSNATGDDANQFPVEPGGTRGSYDELNGHGVYILRDANGEIRYIGRGDAPRRLTEHRQPGSTKDDLKGQILFNNNLPFDQAYSLENELINMFGGPRSINPSTQLRNDKQGIAESNSGFVDNEFAANDELVIEALRRAYKLER